MASKYREDEINQLVDQLANRTFEYNQDEDPLYQAYKTQYENQGNRAMKDTLAQVSARTGGLASSYAVGAAQDSYNNYMNQLNDKATDLYQLALSRYNNETSNMQNLLSTYQTLGNTEYSREQDAYNNAYQASRDAISDARYADETAYNRNQDALNWAYKNQQTNSGGTTANATDRLYEIAQQTGLAEDYEKYFMSEYPEMTLTQLAAAMNNVGYSTVADDDVISEEEFNNGSRSSQLLKNRYGTYNNYLKEHSAYQTQSTNTGREEAVKYDGTILNKVKSIKETGTIKDAIAYLNESVPYSDIKAYLFEAGFTQSEYDAWYDEETNKTKTENK